MQTDKVEEKHPLLFLVVDNNAEGYTRTNGKFFERHIGIAKGAGSVIRDWPSHLGSYWTTFIFTFVVLITFLIVLMASVTMRLTSFPKCNISDTFDNGTVHLVHGPEKWTERQLNMVDKIASTFPQTQIHLIVIRKESTLLSTLYQKHAVLHVPDDHASDSKHHVIKRDLVSEYKNDNAENPVARNININDKNTIGPANTNNNWQVFNTNDFFNAIFGRRKNQNLSKPTTPKPKITSFFQLMRKYPNIKLTTITFKKIFFHTPLHYFWRFHTDEVKIFAVRALQLFQYGGITYDLYLNKTEEKRIRKPKFLGKVMSTENNIDFLIRCGQINFYKLKRGYVSLGQNGEHMETATPCHSYFGEILMDLKRYGRSATPGIIINSTLENFNPNYVKLL